MWSRPDMYTHFQASTLWGRMSTSKKPTQMMGMARKKLYLCVYAVGWSVSKLEEGGGGVWEVFLLGRLVGRLVGWRRGVGLDGGRVHEFGVLLCVSVCVCVSVCLCACTYPE